MKKITFLISFLALIILSSTAIGQDSTEIRWAKHFQKAIKNRPNLKMFSEEEAWRVLTGEISSSKEFAIHSFEFKNLKCMVKKNTTLEIYSRSKTSSIDGCWYSNTKSFNEGEWQINWIFVIPLSVSLLLLFLSLFGGNKYYSWLKKEGERNPNIGTVSNVTGSYFSVIFFVYFLVFIFFINSLKVLKSEDPAFYCLTPIVITALALLIVINKIKKREEEGK